MNNTKKDFWRIILTTLALVAAIVAVATFCGCRSSGVRIVSSSSTYTNLAEINYDEYKWPVFSFISGPKVTVWVNREYEALKSVHAVGSVTNTTSAFAIYSTSDNKFTSLDVDFQPVSTNAMESAASE